MTERDPIYSRPSFPDWGVCEFAETNDPGGVIVIEGQLVTEGQATEGQEHTSAGPTPGAYYLLFLAMSAGVYAALMLLFF